MTPKPSGAVAESPAAAPQARSTGDRGASAPVASIAKHRVAELGPVVAGWVLPFTLVLYLALEGGGYEEVARSRAGIAVWTVVLLGALAGTLPRARPGLAASVGFGVFAAFAAWTGLSTIWSESAGESFAELARVATYLGALALALSVQGPEGPRRMVGAVATALMLVGALALLSRLHPAWFPANEVNEQLVRARLNYPLNYWNGLAELLAMGVPLLLGAALQARRPALQALAAAAIPIMALAIFFTYSRGGALAAALGVAVLFALHPRRLSMLPVAALAAAGSALMIAATTQRFQLKENYTAGDALNQQGYEMMVVTVLVCGGVALLRTALGLAERHRLGPRLRVSRRRTAQVWAAIIAGIAALAIAAGLPSQAGDAWEDFKNPDIAPSGSTRLADVSGNGRYQYWSSAIEANSTSPLLGIGAGTFEHWWTREGTLDTFARFPHSTYFGALAEVGIVGALLIVAFIVAVAAFGVRAALRGDPGRRGVLAAALGASAAFAFAPAVDWVWQLAVIPVTFLLLAGAILGAQDSDKRPLEEGPGRGAWRDRIAGRGAIALVAIPGLVALTLSLLAGSAINDSQAASQRADVEEALEAADAAKRWQPFSAAPRLQRALVLEQMERYPEAASAAREAIEREPLNWRHWFALSRIERSRGRLPAAEDALSRARELNPRSPALER